MPTSPRQVATDLLVNASTRADLRWVVKAMERIGFAAQAPTQAQSAQAAVFASTLLHRGNIVAAKMVHDEALRNLPDYKAAPFSASFETLLTVFTQPVQHASYPSAVRARDETWPSNAEHTDTHGVDIERSSEALAEVIQRVSTAQRALGVHYKRPPIRYYILAQGFRDDVALKAARGAICAEGLSDGLRQTLDIASRFVAMPSTVSSPSRVQ